MWGRRLVLGVLVLLVLAGGLSLFGENTATGRGSGGGYDLTVQYARVARAGLDAPFRITVHNPAGFGKAIDLTVTGDYFTMFESQGFSPDPSSSTRDGKVVHLTFDPPPSGTTFVVDYDAYIQPDSQSGRSATVSVVDASSHPLASVAVDTFLLP